MARFTRSALCALVVSAFAAATASAASISYTADLNGPSEAPPNASPGTGVAIVDIDPVAHTMRVQVTFSGLVGNAILSHIHAATDVPGTGTAGVATRNPTFVDFPMGVTSGTYDHTFDMTDSSTYNPSYLGFSGGTPASAEAALFSAIANGQAYLDIHTNGFSNGEIRGFFQPAAVPTPAALPAGLALVGGLLAFRRRQA